MAGVSRFLGTVLSVRKVTRDVGGEWIQGSHLAKRPLPTHRRLNSAYGRDLTVCELAGRFSVSRRFQARNVPLRGAEVWVPSQQPAFFSARIQTCRREPGRKLRVALLGLTPPCALEEQDAVRPG